MRYPCFISASQIVQLYYVFFSEVQMHRTLQILQGNRGDCFASSTATVRAVAVLKTRRGIVVVDFYVAHLSVLPIFNFDFL